uniref:Uncharacterized protein n=1 Tax=Aegilops tauschii subsp. strangulata TaxID=200361 RepID=A0A453EC53_AEGTS
RTRVTWDRTTPGMAAGTITAASTMAASTAASTMAASTAVGGEVLKWLAAAIARALYDGHVPVRPRGQSSSSALVDSP